MVFRQKLTCSPLLNESVGEHSFHLRQFKEAAMHRAAFSGTALFRFTCILLCMLGAGAQAQVSSTSLRGTVMDSTGALVPGAAVAITNPANGFSATQTTDSSGRYSFPQLMPGTYTVHVSAAGFAATDRKAQLLVSEPATIDVKLGVVAAEQNVNVSAEAETLNSTDASIGNAMNNQFIQAVPTEGRNVPDLLSVQPGVLYLGKNVNQDTDSRSGAVAGARSDQGNVTLDGIDDNDQVNGYAFTGVLRSTQDSTEEFRVTTSNSTADQGRSSGAQVSLITKSGTNSFHGSAYEYYRPPFAAANDWFYKQAEIENGQPNIASKLLRNTFGGSLGGPVRKDKLFFFFNYEGQRTSENLVETRTVPSASYRAGNLTYEDANGSLTTLNPAQLSTLDGACTANGVCPWGPGGDPNVLRYWSQYPLNTSFNTGDGYNTGAYTFSSPAPASLNTSILKVDYVLNDRNRFFVRGNLQKDTTDGDEQFPGQPASYVIEDNTKGLVGGYTWAPTASLVNDLRYGYVRQGYSNRGVGTGNYVDFRFVDQFNAETRTTIVNVPVHNIVDNLSWSKGSHTIQLGGNWRLITNNRSTDALSYSSANSNPYWLNNEPDPSALDGVPAYSQGFANSFLIAYANLVGTVPQLNSQYNYSVNRGGGSGALLDQGAFLNRSFRTNEFEYYVSDSWRATPKLTLTYGLRHTLLQTPYEINGQQVTPTIDTDAWYKQREAAAQAGQVYEPLLQFVPSGKGNGRPGYWPRQKLNIAPRISIAYAPDPRTTLRAGFGLYYDHYGQSVVNTFDQEGSFGLTNAFVNPAAGYGTETAPRFTGKRDLPNIDTGPSPGNPIQFPYAPSATNFLITEGIDNKLKTPYSEVIDASVQRQIPGGLTLEVDYVGRLGRHLLQQLDLTQPVDFVDTQGGGDYFAAGTALSRQVDAHHGDPNAQVDAIPYFEHVFSYLAKPSESATQFIYTNEWAPYRYTYGESTSLADLDFYCYYGCPLGTRFFQGQFSTLNATASIGMSYYNAAQVIVRHPSSHGLQYDFNYTFSKSIDYGSDAERSKPLGASGSFSTIENTWNPALNRAVSDFDTRHLISWDWVYEVPFGRGRRYGSNIGRWEDAALGGWQVAGLGRWSSGLPFSVNEPGYTTDWEFPAFAVPNGKVAVHKHLDANGTPQVFANPGAINSGVRSPDGPMRLPYPGEAGGRNIFRGDGFFEVDASVSKSWILYRESRLSASWEAFNFTNSVRFDTNPNTSLGNQLTSGSLGKYSAVLNRPRVQQFSLRVDF